MTNTFIDLTQLTAPQVDNIIDPTTGKVVTTVYSTAGKLHRTNGPAEIHYDSNGQPWAQIWAQNGKWHREDGPAAMYKQHPKPQGAAAIAANGKYIAEWHFNGEYKDSHVLDEATFNKHWHKVT